MVKKTSLIIFAILIISSLLSVAFATHANNSKETIKIEIEPITIDECIGYTYNNYSLSVEDSEKMEQMLRKSGWYDLNKNTDNESKEFELIEHEYNTIVNYIKSILSDHTSNGYICLGVDGVDESNIRLSIASQDGKLLDITKDVKISLLSIQKSFNNMGYDLDTIRVKDNTIAFESIDGQYSLVYLLNDGVKTATETTTESNLVKFKDNWYHKVS